MKYAVTVKLKTYSHKSFELLTTLGFTIFIKDDAINTITVIDDYRKTTKIIAIERLQNPTTSFICVYNGDKLPSDCITELLEDDHNVTSYTIEKRDS